MKAEYKRYLQIYRTFWPLTLYEFKLGKKKIEWFVLYSGSNKHEICKVQVTIYKHSKILENWMTHDLSIMPSSYKLKTK